MSKRMESVEMRISNLAKNSRANSVIPSNASRAGSNEAASPRVAGHPLDTSILDQKIKAAVEPMHKALGLLKADVTSLQQAQQKLDKPDDTSSLTQVPSGSRDNTQTNGTHANGIHLAGFPENRIHVLEQAIQVCKKTVEGLSRQHQNLTTVEICKNIVHEIREMYPHTSPASKREIDGLRLACQQLIPRVDALDAHVANFNRSLEAAKMNISSVASLADGAAKCAKAALDEVKKIKADSEKAMGQLTAGTSADPNEGETRPMLRESVGDSIMRTQ